MFDRDAFIFDRRSNQIHYERRKHGKLAFQRTIPLASIEKAVVDVDQGKPLDLQPKLWYRIKLAPKSQLDDPLTSLYRYNLKQDQAVNTINAWLDSPRPAA
ncbi:hypothetical protein [Roseobacter weihaiensis]|uniref:hypothetical protein n=1 Tax=Roseobacter weihaiensis TaxID=2763262 RepID=UPI001D0B3FF8|nr:hypothetical protein [Roseobacter sp. H9]